jgi:hypothetical protein
VGVAIHRKKDNAEALRSTEESEKERRANREIWRSRDRKPEEGRASPAPRKAVSKTTSTVTGLFQAGADFDFFVEAG